MSEKFFKSIENDAAGTEYALGKILGELKFTKDGLIPAIAQQFDTGTVLMQAWMNVKSIRKSIESGRVCYWSRSRKKFWFKGEESGNVQSLKEIRIDCDGDSLLLIVDQTGPACHTNRQSCFFLTIKNNDIVVSQ
ncbi:MAG: phosphoribosyl-AMP cyclohydrolase [Pseudomonadales bacterium]|nr:phosphoribosyl-AMP cyclohydrolase [Pseudomonadales bacterium]